MLEEKALQERLNALISEAVAQRSCVKTVLLQILQNSQENTSTKGLFFNKVTGLGCNFVKKETLAQMFPCEFCKICKYTFLMEHLQWLLL